jgi:hypothetical protein
VETQDEDWVRYLSVSDDKSFCPILKRSEGSDEVFYRSERRCCFETAVMLSRVGGRVSARTLESPKATGTCVSSASGAQACVPGEVAGQKSPTPQNPPGRSCLAIA